MATKVKTIKLNDFSAAVDRAVAASTGKKLPGSLILGRSLTTAQAASVDVNALAKSVTADVAPAFAGSRLAPKVVIGDRIIILGFIIRQL